MEFESIGNDMVNVTFIMNDGHRKSYKIKRQDLNTKLNNPLLISTLFGKNASSFPSEVQTKINRLVLNNPNIDIGDDKKPDEIEEFVPVRTKIKQAFDEATDPTVIAADRRAQEETKKALQAKANAINARLSAMENS